jgi:hypothetical protein
MDSVRVTMSVPAGSASASAHSVHELPTNLSAWLFDFLAVVYGQIAALVWGESRGMDVDHPHGLAKVTRTE